MVQMQHRAGTALLYWVPLLSKFQPAGKYRNAGIGNVSVSHITNASIFTYLRDMASHQLSISLDSSGFTVLLKDCQ